VAGAIILAAGDLGEHVELEGGAVFGACGKLLDVVTAEVLLELEVADGGVDQKGVAVGAAEAGAVAGDVVVLVAGFGVALGVEELVGVCLAFGGGERSAQGLQLDAGLRGLAADRLLQVDAAEDGGCVGGLAGELVGAREGVAEIDVLGDGGVFERSEDAKRAGGVAGLEIGVGEQDRRGDGEDAIGEALGEVVKKRISFGSAACLAAASGKRRSSM
jgi:hypothetical protein